MKRWGSERAASAWGRWRRRLGLVALWAVLAAGSLTMLIPLLWMVQVSLGDENTLVTRVAPWRLSDWRAGDLRWGNYAEALTAQPFARYAWNTVLVTVFGLLGELSASALVGYAFARIRFPGRGPLFILMLSTMMIPAQVTMVPTFLIFRGLGWVDTLKPLIVPAFAGNAFSIFLFRQFFVGLPRDFDDAALIDGCSRFQNSRDLFTLSLGLASFQGLHATQWHLLMAASLVVMLPCIVLFFVAQRHFVQGIVMSGIKG